jgi:DNA-binding NarL/FixJ family response regulator
MTRLILLDSVPMFLSGVQQALATEADVSIVASTSEPAAAIGAAQAGGADLLVTGDPLGAKRASDVTATIRREVPTMRTIICSASLGVPHIRMELERHADALFPRWGTGAQLVECIRTTMNGQRWSASDIRWGFESAGPAEAPSRSRSRNGHSVDADEILKQLTRRERDVLFGVARGWRNQDVATSLGITEGTVKVHLNSIFQKLRLKTRSQLVVLAHQTGVVAVAH